MRQSLTKYSSLSTESYNDQPPMPRLHACIHTHARRREVEQVLGGDTPVSHEEFQKMMHGLDPLVAKHKPKGK